MNRLAPFGIVTPSCFGSESVFNNFSAACRTCAALDKCAHENEMDELLGDLLCDPGEGVTTPRTVDPTSERPSRSSPDAASYCVVAVTSPANEIDRRALPMEYAFPIPVGRRYEHFSNAELVDELVALIARGCLTSSATSYPAVRADLCAVQVEMNLRQQHAPRFRPQPPLQKNPGSGNAADLARDRQVIDLHWRAYSSEKPSAPVHGYSGIFDDDCFDFETASRFAQLDWKSQTKVVHLHVNEDMQWEHAVLQLSSIRDKWRTIENGDVRGHVVKQAGAPHVESDLRQSMSNSPHIKTHIPGLVLIWKAQRIVGNSPKRVAKLVALMSGKKPRDASAVRRSIISLDEHLKSGSKGKK